jgi:hypothetical protein
VWYLLAWLVGQVALFAYNQLGLWMWNWTVAHDLDLLRVVWFGRPQWQRPPLLLISCVNQMMIGWIIARLHRQHRAAAVLSCGTVSLIYSIAIGFFVFQPRMLLPMLWPVALIAMPAMRISPLLVVLICLPVCFLLGGVAGSSPHAARAA